jgi:hypothetical protein
MGKAKHTKARAAIAKAEGNEITTAEQADAELEFAKLVLAQHESGCACFLCSGARDTVAKAERGE